MVCFPQKMEGISASGPGCPTAGQQRWQNRAHTEGYKLQLARLHAQARPALRRVVEAHVGLGKGFSLGGRCHAETVHVMVAVALDMGHAQAGGQQSVLLHGQAGLAGQVLSRQQQALRLPGHAPGAVQRAVNAFAGFGGNAAIAQAQALLQHLLTVVRLVQDHRHLDAQAANRLAQGQVPRQGLLQQQGAG
jgi:hypothetical protein